MAADVGEGLFFAGQNHVAIRVIASEKEHNLITTNPLEIERKRKERELIAAPPPPAIRELPNPNERVQTESPVTPAPVPTIPQTLGSEETPFLQEMGGLTPPTPPAQAASS